MVGDVSVYNRLEMLEFTVIQQTQNIDLWQIKYTKHI